ncbi:MAG: amidase family protein [Pseudomonadota bacterium]
MDRREALQLLAAGALAASAGCSRREPAPSATDLAALDCIAQADLAASGTVSPLELVEAAVARVERLNPELNAVTFADFERALAAAPNARGPLAGVPYLLKDLNAYAGMPLTRGSRLFADQVSEAQSPFTDRIDGAGLVVLGKSNTPEFGLLPTTEPLLHGPTRNPWNLAHSTGGSSGGAAAAVAARIVPAAQASDGGGSIRIPAAQCGLVGLKPSVGRFPDQGYGQQAWPISIKHAVTHSVRDSALLLALTELTEGGSLLPVGFTVRERLAPQRIAVTVSSIYGDPDPAVAAAVERTAETLESLGHEISLIETDTPLHDPAFGDDFLTLWAAGAAGAVNLVEEKTGTPADQTGLLEPATIALGELMNARPADALERAVEGLGRYKAGVDDFLSGYDAWLTPVTGSPAPEIGFLAPDLDYDTLMPRVQRFAAYTPTHNAAGTPAISIPAGLAPSGLPVGVQVATRIGGEALLLQLAYQLEEAAPWADALPPLHA